MNCLLRTRCLALFSPVVWYWPKSKRKVCLHVHFHASLAWEQRLVETGKQLGPSGEGCSLSLKKNKPRVALNSCTTGLVDMKRKLETVQENGKQKQNATQQYKLPTMCRGYIHTLHLQTQPANPDPTEMPSGEGCSLSLKKTTTKSCLKLLHHLTSGYEMETGNGTGKWKAETECYTTVQTTYHV